MAYDYFIVDSQSSQNIAKRVSLPPYLITEMDSKMVSTISAGEVDYYGNFTRDELLTRFKAYANQHADILDTYPWSQYHEALDYVQNSSSDEFTVSAIYWTSGI